MYGAHLLLPSVSGVILPPPLLISTHGKGQQVVWPNIGAFGSTVVITMLSACLQREEQRHSQSCFVTRQSVGISDASDPVIDICQAASTFPPQSSWTLHSDCRYTLFYRAPASFRSLCMLPFNVRTRVRAAGYASVTCFRPVTRGITLSGKHISRHPPCQHCSTWKVTVNRRAKLQRNLPAERLLTRLRRLSGVERPPKIPTLLALFPRS